MIWCSCSPALVLYRHAGVVRSAADAIATCDAGKLLPGLQHSALMLQWSRRAIDRVRCLALNFKKGKMLLNIANFRRTHRAYSILVDYVFHSLWNGLSCPSVIQSFVMMAAPIMHRITWWIWMMMHACRQAGIAACLAPSAQILPVQV